jgi:hypothetical protein
MQATHLENEEGRPAKRLRLPPRQRDKDPGAETSGCVYKPPVARSLSAPIVGVVFFKDRGVARWRPWFAANEAKYQVRLMHETMQETAAWSSGVVTARDLPHVALLAGTALEVFPGVLELLGAPYLPLQIRDTVHEALAWISFVREGHNPPEQPDGDVPESVERIV